MLEEEFAWAGDARGFRFLSVGTKPMMKSFDAMVQSLGYEYPAHQFLVKANDDRRYLQAWMEHMKAAQLRRRMNNEMNSPSNFEGLVLGCIDADFCK